MVGWFYHTVYITYKNIYIYMKKYIKIYMLYIYVIYITYKKIYIYYLLLWIKSISFFGLPLLKTWMNYAS